MINDNSKGQTQTVISIGFAILCLIILIAIVLSGFGFGWLSEAHQDTDEIRLPVLVLVGALTLLVSLGFLTNMFASLGIENKKQALGLPEGSVRALIALLLVLLFSILSIFLYRQLRSPDSAATTITHEGITEAMKDDIIAKIPSEQILLIEQIMAENDEDILTYKIIRQVNPIEANEASQRFAEQILTTISTLVVAVAGFYFGSRAGEAVGELASTTTERALTELSNADESQRLANTRAAELNNAAAQLEEAYTQFQKTADATERAVSLIREQAGTTRLGGQPEADKPNLVEQLEETAASLSSNIQQLSEQANKAQNAAIVARARAKNS